MNYDQTRICFRLLVGSFAWPCDHLSRSERAQVLHKKNIVRHVKATSHSHDSHHSSFAMAEKSQISIFVRDPRGLFLISGPQWHVDWWSTARRATTTIEEHHNYDVARPSYVIAPISRQNGLSRGLQSCWQAFDIDDGRTYKHGPCRLVIDWRSMGARQHNNPRGCVVEVRWGIYIPWRPHPSIQIEGTFAVKLGSKNIKRKTKEFKDNLARKINI